MWFELFNKLSLFEKNLTQKYGSNSKAEIVNNAIDDILEKLLTAMVQNLSLEVILEASHFLLFKLILIFS